MRNGGFNSLLILAMGMIIRKYMNYICREQTEIRQKDTKLVEMDEPGFEPRTFYKRVSGSHWTTESV